ISDKFISLAKDNDEKKRQFATAVLAQWLSDNSLQIVDLLSIFQRLAKGNKNSRSVLQQVFTSVLETEQSYRVIEMFVRLHASLPEKQFKTVSTKLLENKRIPGALQQCAGDKSRYKAAEDFFLLLWRNEETETLANKYFEPFVSKDLKEPEEMAVRVLMRRIQKTDDPARLGLNRANASLSRSVVEALIRSMNEDGLGDASYFLFQCSLSDNPNIRSIYVQTLYLGMKNSADWARTQLNALSTLNDESLDLAKLIWNLIIKDEAIRQYAVDKAFEALQDVDSGCFQIMSELMSENETMREAVLKKIQVCLESTEKEEGPSEKENAKIVLQQIIWNTETREFVFPWIDSILLTKNNAQQPVIDCLFYIFNAGEAEISARALDALVNFSLQEGTIPDSFKAYDFVDSQKFLVRRIARAPAEKRKELCLELLQNSELEGKTALEAVMKDESISIEALKELIEQLLAEPNHKTTVLGCLKHSLLSGNYRIVQALKGVDLFRFDIPEILSDKIIGSEGPISISDELNPLIRIKAAKVVAEILVLLLKGGNRIISVLQSLDGFAGSNNTTEKEAAIHVFMNAEVGGVNKILSGYASSSQMLARQFAATVFANLKREHPNDDRLKEFLKEATDPNVWNTQEEYLFQLLQADLSNGSGEPSGFQQAIEWLKDKKKSSIVFTAIDRLIQSSSFDLQPVISLFSVSLATDFVSDSLVSFAKDKDEKKQAFARAVLEKWLSDDGIPTMALLSTFVNLLGFSKGNKNSRSVLQQVIGTVLEAENNYRVIEMVVFLKDRVQKNAFSKLLRDLMAKENIQAQLPEKIKQCTSTPDKSNSAAKFLFSLLQEQKTKVFARAVFQDFVDSEDNDVRDIAKRVLIQEMQQAGKKAFLFNECVCSSEEKMRLCAGNALLNLIKDKSTCNSVWQYMKEYAKTEKTRNVVLNAFSLLLAKKESRQAAFDELDTYAKNEFTDQRIVATKVMFQLIKNENMRAFGIEHLKQCMTLEGKKEDIRH
ncbi:MAG: hypothetical protein KJ588_02765, partial [Gammaproteobacteria bacterium]|nr:hypothetical protein [Gammaproteobacteria bacterium]